MLKYTDGFKNWDIQDAIPNLELFFIMKLPKPLSEGIIMERNNRGRIVKSKVPVII